MTGSQGWKRVEVGYSCQEKFCGRGRLCTAQDLESKRSRYGGKGRVEREFVKLERGVGTCILILKSRRELRGTFSGSGVRRLSSEEDSGGGFSGLSINRTAGGVEVTSCR